MNKLLISILLLLVISPYVSALNNISIDVFVQPRGPTSTEYNVVGDTFTYLINITNLDKEEINNSFQVCITGRYYNDSCRIFQENISSGETITIKPTQEGNKVDIFPFDASGDYRIKISSQNLIFIENYSSSYSSFPSQYILYFDAMPLWQYNLFEKQLSSAQDSIDVSKKSEKLISDMSGSLKVMADSSGTNRLIAFIALFISILSLLASLSEEQKRNYLKGMVKSVIRFIGLVIFSIALSLLVIYIISLFL